MKIIRRAPLSAFKFRKKTKVGSFMLARTLRVSHVWIEDYTSRTSVSGDSVIWSSIMWISTTYQCLWRLKRSFFRIGEDRCLPCGGVGTTVFTVRWIVISVFYSIFSFILLILYVLVLFRPLAWITEVAFHKSPKLRLTVK